MSSGGVSSLAILAPINARMSVDEAGYRRRHDRLWGRRRRRRRRRLLSAANITSAPPHGGPGDGRPAGWVAHSLGR